MIEFSLAVGVDNVIRAELVPPLLTSKGIPGVSAVIWNVALGAPAAGVETVTIAVASFVIEVVSDWAT